MSLTQVELDAVVTAVTPDVVAAVLESLAALNDLQVDPVGAHVNRVMTSADLSASLSSLTMLPAKASIASATLDSSINTLVVRDDVKGGLGQTRWKRVSTPSTVYSNWHQQSVDGAWWQVAEVEVNPYMFGAVGDASTDDTTALNAMVDYANWIADKSADPFYTGMRARILFPPAKGWNTTTGINPEMACNIEMHSPLRVIGAAGVAKIGILGKDTYAASNLNKGVRWGKWLDLWVMRVTQSNWSQTNDIGVSIPSSPYVMEYRSHSVAGFRTGHKITGSYHTIEFGEVFGAKEAAICECTTADEFSNHLRITAKEFSCGGVNAGQSRYGIVFKGGPTVGMNTVSFSGCSFELGLSTAQSGNPSAEVRCIVFDGSTGSISDVHCYGLRSESNGGVLVKTLGTVSNTIVEWLHAEDPNTYPEALILDNQATVSANNFTRRTTSVFNFKDIWKSGVLVNNAVGWGANVSVRGLEALLNNGTSTPPSIVEFSQGGWNDFGVSGHLVCYGAGTGSYHLGRRVNLNGENSLSIKVVKQLATAWPMLIMCWNAAGSQITAANKVYQGYLAVPTSTAFNGSYQVGPFVSGVSTSDAASFSFATDVAVVGFYLATTTREFTIGSPRGLATTFAITDKYGLDYFAASAPTTVSGLTYQTGQVAKSIAPATGSPIGWVRTASAWSAMANL